MILIILGFLFGLNYYRVYNCWGKDSGCLTCQAKDNSEVFWNDFLSVKTPKCSQCHNSKFILAKNETKCISECPYGEWQFMLNQNKTITKVCT